MVESVSDLTVLSPSWTNKWWQDLLRSRQLNLQSFKKYLSFQIKQSATLNSVCPPSLLNPLKLLFSMFLLCRLLLASRSERKKIFQCCSCLFIFPFHHILPYLVLVFLIHSLMCCFIFSGAHLQFFCLSCLNSLYFKWIYVVRLNLCNAVGDTVLNTIIKSFYLL